MQNIHIIRSTILMAYRNFAIAAWRSHKIHLKTWNELHFITIVVFISNWPPIRCMFVNTTLTKSMACLYTHIMRHSVHCINLAIQYKITLNFPTWPKIVDLYYTNLYIESSIELMNTSSDHRILAEKKRISLVLEFNLRIKPNQKFQHQIFSECTLIWVCVRSNRIS